MSYKDELIIKLKEENGYLKELLRQHNIPFERPKVIEQLNLSNDEKIDAYLSYFIGRDDIFAYEYYTSDGRRTFSPACKGRPNLTGYCPDHCKECDNKQYSFSRQKANNWNCLPISSFSWFFPICVI